MVFARLLRYCAKVVDIAMLFGPRCANRWLYADMDPASGCDVRLWKRDDRPMYAIRC